MRELDDMALVQEYAARGSEEAFAAVVQRHVNLVYSVALRKTGNPQAAEEIVQTVFVILARKAGRLSKGTVLSGWLYETARLTANNFLRGEMRRVRREREAWMSPATSNSESEWWLQVAPLLEDAMGRLGKRDRDCIVQRFFEGKSLRDVATVLGISEDGACRIAGAQ
jgi:RNA polymerase sigma factor (sigma-70 family)